MLGDLLKGQREDLVAAEFLPVLEEFQRIVARGEAVTEVERQRFIDTTSRLIQDAKDQTS